MTVSIPADLEDYARAKVQSGGYTCASEVVYHGLSLLQGQDTLWQIKLERLRQDLAVGLEAGERGELALLDGQEIIAEGRMRLAERALNQ